jgi:alcohol dehydrogenase (cytochrome c)
LANGRRLSLIVVVLVVLCAGFVLAVGSIRWRVHTALLVAGGRIPDISLREALLFMQPGSGQQRMGFLRETRNPHAVLHVPEHAQGEQGGILFRDRCAACHGPSGNGGPLAPSLAGRAFKHGESDWAVYRTVRDGVPDTPMAGHGSLSPDQLWSLVAHVRSLQVAAEPGQEPSTPASITASASLPPDELAGTAEPAQDWLTYSGSYSSVRRSTLSQITPHNVKNLTLRWMRPIAAVGPVIETTPIVRKGVMYITAPPGKVKALNALDGSEIWVYQHGAIEGAGANRGVAMLNDLIYYGSWDAKLVALSAATGKVLWKAQVADHPRAFISSAPLALRDIVVVGVGTIAGGGSGVIVAFDAKTGTERWRFRAIPGPGEYGNDTWSGESWKEGGAPTWLTGSYDPASDILYWGVGNPKPDYRTEVRKGDNLYSNSVVALQGSTGKLLWHFQFTPADDHDWDSNQVPVLADLPSPQGVQKLLLWANRNAFYYVFDRLSGKFINGVPFASQNWAKELDANGRPVRQYQEFRREGNLVFPGTSGATNWWSPALDVERNLLFVPVIEQGMIFTPQNVPRDSTSPFYTAIRALEPSTGKMVWEHRFPARRTEPFVGGGVMATRTGLLFAADRSTFFALDSVSGKKLWQVETGSEVHTPPTTFEVDGQQFVSITSGSVLMTFSLPSP